MGSESGVNFKSFSKLRNMLIIWGAVSAATGPLTTAFQWLATREGILTGGASGLSTFVILANMCLLTGVLTIVAGLLSVLFVGAAAAEGRFTSFIVLALIAYYGFTRPHAQHFLLHLEPTLRDPRFYVVIPFWIYLVFGMLAFADLISIFWSDEVEEYSPIILLVTAASLSLIMVLGTSSVRQPLLMVWKWAGSSTSDGVPAIPLHDVTFLGWALMIFGVVIYGLGFVMFMQWRTKGKWWRNMLNEMTDRSESSST